MGDRMRPMSFAALMGRVLDEYKTTGSIFGIKEMYKADGRTLPFFGGRIETPFGPAAGPHTQLSENIITAYLCGARFFELKTVQTLDGEDLPVSKPCITAKDECYNVEWSTELTVADALSEYVRAWYALKLISKELGLGDSEGFVFNMSVGYDLEGISSPKIDGFIEGLKDAADTDAFKEAAEWTRKNISRFKNVDAGFIDGISPHVCDSITLSTLHGCPPAEIERIARYLLTEKKLNTFIKCNPTLLGYEYARGVLDNAGFSYMSFDDGHFKSDLQFSDAVPMLRRLQELADGLGLGFGVKLSNTLPVDIKAGELPGEEMYMSGRALYPLTVSLADKLTREFDGRLRISYSGGADAENSAALFDAGIWPITLATYALKPGGYKRLLPVAESFAECEYAAFGGVDVKKLADIKENALCDEKYKKDIKPNKIQKLDADIPITDCFIAPCHGVCPINQDIPAYLKKLEEKDALGALRIITERNPLPHITGTICPHPCMSRCTRGFYEGAVDIRAEKLAACAAVEALTAELKPRGHIDMKIAVIGGGPAGMAAAFFAAREGAAVTLFEKEKRLGGLVRYVIPDFRIPEKAIDGDEKLLRAMGADIRTGQAINSPEQLKDFDCVIVAVGANKPGRIDIKYASPRNAIEFLEEIKRGEKPYIGEYAAVIGGGNTAMDAARAAKRIPSVKKVTIVYRRDRLNMPADGEELGLALSEGVDIEELALPVSFKDGMLGCERMALGEPDESGRRSPKGTGEYFELRTDSIIAAVGEKRDSEFIDRFEGALVIGDALGGPATVVEAILDAAIAVAMITGTQYDRYEDENNAYAGAEERKSRLLKKGETPECLRCMSCGSVCESCVDVCPNRANVAIDVNGRRQILHLDYLCNECGNCETFCPYSGAPYKDKLTLFSCAADAEASHNTGFYMNGEDTEFNLDSTRFIDDMESVDGMIKLIKAVQEEHPYLIVNGGGGK